MTARLAAESAGLLRDVLERPGEDAPRMLYADWCEDNGDPERGEFVRVQVELAGWKFDPPDEAFHRRMRCECVGCNLRRRERELWVRWREEWFPPHRPIGGLFGPLAYALEPDRNLRVPNLIVRRGFVAAISLTLADFEKHAKAIFSAHPVEEVALTDRVPLQARDGEREYPEFRWFAVIRPRPAVAAELPRALFDRLAGDGNDWARHYLGETDAAARAAALADLSRACVRHGRDLAGLPEFA